REERQDIRGQALFLRGYFYFLLVNKFGGVPLVLESTTSENVTDYQVPRSPIKVVYGQILEDMHQAVDLVPDIRQVESPGRVSKSAVWGILARVNMYMAGQPLNDKSRYEEVIKAARQLIDMDYHKLNSL